MCAALTLAGYALLLAIAGPRLLKHDQQGRSPRCGLLLWLAALFSAVLAIVLALVLLVLPAQVLVEGIPHLVEKATAAVMATVHHPLVDLPSTLGMTGIAALVLRLAHVTFGDCSLIHSERRERVRVVRKRLRDLPSLRLSCSGEPPGREVLVIPDASPTAFCVATRPPVVVLTSSALDALTPEQVSAVLAHEEHHLQGHHHRVLGVALILARAFRPLPLMGSAPTALNRLLELRADEVAEERTSRHAVLDALVRLAVGRAEPPGATVLPATGGDVVVRVRRLLSDDPRLPATRRAGHLAAAVALTMAPVVLSMTFALGHPASGCCLDVVRAGSS